MKRLQAENQAAMQAAEELHRKKLADEREGERDEEETAQPNGGVDPMAVAEAEALRQNA